jgi:uncharacterized membrane protein YoaK (UPF0700 family)
MGTDERSGVAVNGRAQPVRGDDGAAILGPHDVPLEPQSPLPPAPALARRSRRLTPSATRDVLLMCLGFSSGAVDAISYIALGKIFTAFMTGNIVFLGLRLAHSDVHDIYRVSIALLAFAAGAYLAIKLVTPSQGDGIWPRRVSLALGVGALAQIVFLALWIAVSGRPATGSGDILTGLSALAMGLQTGAVVSFGLRGVFTTAATATLVNFMGDVAGWPLASRAQGRFAGVLVGIVAGAAAGATLLTHVPTLAPVLPLVTSLLVIATAHVALRSAR